VAVGGQGRLLGGRRGHDVRGGGRVHRGAHEACAGRGVCVVWRRPRRGVRRHPIARVARCQSSAGRPRLHGATRCRCHARSGGVVWRRETAPAVSVGWQHQSDAGRTPASCSRAGSMHMHTATHRGWRRWWCRHLCSAWQQRVSAS
jgi:hypothetical protein